MSTTEKKEPWRWDGPRFGNWLRKWRDSEGLGWREISERTGLHESTLQGLARGTQGPRGGRNAAAIDKSLDPPISTVARVAQGLGLELTYVIRQAGIDPHNDRWTNFNTLERSTLHEVLRFHLLLEQQAGLTPNPVVPRLLAELEASLPTPAEKEEANAY
jgi:transcriptional regulator with XRE-family HTH domain